MSDSHSTDPSSPAKSQTAKPIRPSMRWAVFARDGFTCRYCGAQAGQPGVHLHADHVVSVAEGGQTTYDNLVAACQKCNGGKSARSLGSAPTSTEVIKRLDDNARTLRDQAEAMASAIEASKRVEQQAINIKCAAYSRKSVSFARGEEQRISKWCQEFGADLVLEWYGIAKRNGIRPRYAVRYVSGIARNHRQEMEDTQADGF